MQKKLRRFLDYTLSLAEKGRPLYRIKPLIAAIDTFCFEPKINTRTAPFIRDAADVKRWMMLVVIALIPNILMAIWNSGVQSWVYGSGDLELMKNYLKASQSLKGYFLFTFQKDSFFTILKEGSLIFLPLMFLSYAVGGICEALIACIRGHEINEGFLVTGMLFPLILPPTIPLWMASIGIAFGVVFGKELFGGTGMNILNPALVARCFLFFTFPGKMTGDIWVGSNPTNIATSLAKINAEAKASAIDGYTQASALSGLNVAVPEIKRIHVDAIASNTLGSKVSTFEILQKHFVKWQSTHPSSEALGSLSLNEMKDFVTGPLESGGLALIPGNFGAAQQFSETSYGLGKFSDGNLFFGNIPGSLGETSILASLLGALFLIWVGVGSWRTMLSFGLAAFLTASLFEWASQMGPDGGAWNSAKFSMPAYRHLMTGGLAFGLVYMVTDPVTSCSLKAARWIFGALAGVVTILIRLINPAYPEGVMLAILFANVFAPLIDYIVLRFKRKPLVKPRGAY